MEYIYILIHRFIDNFIIIKSINTFYLYYPLYFHIIRVVLGRINTIYNLI